ncbi:MAG: DoxX family protein [Bacteroidota bacterium]
MTTTNLQVAELLIRLFAGVLLIFQGYDKLFRIGITGVIEVFKTDAQNKHIPVPLISALAWFSSFTEFFGGILLLTGLCTSYALYALGLDLLLVAIAFTYMETMWDMKHVFPRLVLITTLLLFPPEYRTISLDHFINLK